MGAGALGPICTFSIENWAVQGEIVNRSVTFGAPQSSYPAKTFVSPRCSTDVFAGYKAALLLLAGYTDEGTVVPKRLDFQTF